MTPASVGFQCPACVSAGSQSSPVYTVTTVGSRAEFTRADQARGFKPYVTYVLLAINLVAFALMAIVGQDVVAANYGMQPLYIAANQEWFRLLSSAFLHWGLLHLGFNMLVLFLIGPTLERIFGHSRYAVLYLMSALGGSVASYVFSSVTTTSVGASGAVFGLLGALIVAGRRLRYDLRQVLILLAINLVIGFLPGSNIDWRAHLGGLLVGALIAAVFTYLPDRRNGVLLQVLACVAVLILLAAVTLARTNGLRAELVRSPHTSALVAPDAAASGPHGTIREALPADRRESMTGEVT